MKISTSNGIEFFEAIEVKTVKELADKALLSNISTSVFKDGKRNIQNFEYADCIGLDIDNDNKKGTPTLSLIEAKKIFSNFKHVILATRSHNVEKHGVVAERFRVILFTDSPIVKANDFYSTWHWLKDQFPWIDNQCKDPSRFWFQHTEVLGLSEQGSVITPIRFTEPEKPTKDGRPVLPGERGKLSNQALQFLEFGVEEGSRNGTVYKVARDFQQALYDFEETEARILSALQRNEIFAQDFTESEARITIRSAYSKDAKHAPRLTDVKPRAFSYVRWGDILEAPDKEEDWVIHGLLLRGGMSVIVGMPKIGKTTLIRQMEKCVLRGEPFLDRKTAKGTIIHYSFDEKLKTSKKHYKTLGLTKNDPLILHFGTASNNDYVKELEEDLIKIKPAIAVVDTLFDMVDSEDVNNYGTVKRQLSIFSALAERTGCHIMFIHHTNKPNNNYRPGSGHSVLGSTAIFGSVDCCLIFERVNDSNLRTLAVEGRGVENLDGVQLRFNKDTQTYKIEAKQDDF